MRNLILLLLFVVLSSNECNMPYRAKIICRDSVSRCQSKLNDSLEITFLYSGMSYHQKTPGVAIICNLFNPSQTAAAIHRNQFSILSARGIAYRMLPMQTAIELKTYTVPNDYPVAPGQKTDYVFSFSSVNQYAKSEAMNLFISDTLYFLYHHDAATDTLSRIVGDDGRIKKAQ